MLDGKMVMTFMNCLALYFLLHPDGFIPFTIATQALQ